IFSARSLALIGHDSEARRAVILGCRHAAQLTRLCEDRHPLWRRSAVVSVTQSRRSYILSASLPASPEIGYQSRREKWCWRIRLTLWFIAEMLGAHDAIRAAISLARDHRDFGDGGFSIRVKQFGSVSDRSEERRVGKECRSR